MKENILNFLSEALEGPALVIMILLSFTVLAAYFMVVGGTCMFMGSGVMRFFLWIGLPKWVGGIAGMAAGLSLFGIISTALGKGLDKIRI